MSSIAASTTAASDCCQHLPPPVSPPTEIAIQSCVARVGAGLTPHVAKL
jgi:hypothetical protein